MSFFYVFLLFLLSPPYKSIPYSCISIPPPLEEEVWFWDWLPTARAHCDFWKANDKMCSGSHPPHLPVHICMLISYIQRYEFSCINARNIWIISLYSVKFFHIHSVSFNAPWKGCNFAVQLRQRSLSAERKLAISPCNELRSKTALRGQAAPRQIWKLALICTRLALSLYRQSGWHTRQSQSSH